ncbi:mavicyanin-like [Telopea speciosissima]|uniref:mavicyanin-like n=1 Tax=Telopea speciosissima TaxID=54955 RepID=UPI001CC3FBA9|nr:mavicyanin-like [Telopea speciosissima]XP_043718206.1 mavicyanin-like [Telopea speciosissima]
MANIRFSRCQFFCTVQFLLLLQSNVFCYQFKVGDLHAWGIPSSANPQIYMYWSEYHQLKIGDSLLFLYPPSQDSIIQVTEQAFNDCNLKDPILYMNDGNSLFNITSPGGFYFTSGVPGHCEKSQKLQISVLFANGSALPPSYAPTGLPDTSPSYPTVFGSIPTASPSLPLQSLSATILAAVLGSTIFMIVSSSI